MRHFEGVIADVDTSGYHRHLNPDELRLAALAAGHAPPRRDDFRYLELGFGQGVSVAFHAAATTGTYWGIDADATHVARARALTTASGARAHLSADAFRAFAVRRDLPEFDYIVLHGVWSWITEENREVIVDLIRRTLAPGGIAYVSYITSPGWASGLPMRQLRSLFAQRGGATRDAPRGGSGALRVAADVLRAGADDEVPDVGRQLDALGTTAQAGRTEACLSADWTLATFPETAARLGKARLTFAGSTRLLDSVDAFRFTPRSRQLLDRIDDRLLRETTKDVLTSTHVRSDVYVKAGPPLADGALAAQWSEQRFVLTTHAGEMPAQLRLPPGPIHLHGRGPGDVIAALADNDHAPKTIAQLCAHPRLARLGADDVIATMLLLAGAGHARTAQCPTAAVVDRCRRLNRHVRARARAGEPVDYLASPVTGGAIGVSRVDLLCLDAVDQGRDTVPGLTRHLDDRLRSRGTGARKAVHRLDARPRGRDALEAVAERFLASTLPMLRAWQAV